jgi:hypothetical protein
MLASGLASYIIAVHISKLVGFLGGRIGCSGCVGIPRAVVSVHFKLSIARIENELFTWYKNEQTAGRMHSQVQRLEPAMFRSYGIPACKLHGGETTGFLACAPVLIAKYGGNLANQRVWDKHHSALPEEFNIIRHCQEHFLRNSPTSEMEIPRFSNTQKWIGLESLAQDHSFYPTTCQTRRLHQTAMYDACSALEFWGPPVSPAWA